MGRSGYFSLNLSANSVMRGRLDARRTLKSLVADLRIKANVPPVTIAMLIVTTPTNVSMIRKRLYDKIHSEKGSSEKFDKFIRDF
ncbi:hypothetical protein DW998_14705 [Parabacteroides distasonis]|nr:hypothetical protein DW998_14705 [Parabacteroides distasonis]